MQQDISSTPFKLRPNVRPIKIAYFFKSGDEEALLSILRLVGTQWGGLRHLIIPITSETNISKFYQDLLQVNEPDWFVGFWDLNNNVNWEIHNGIKRQLSNIFPYKQINLWHGEYFEKHDPSAHALHVIPANILNTHTLIDKFISSTFDSEILELTIFGIIYPGQEEFYRRTIDILDQVVKIDSTNFWTAQMELSAFASIINLTTFGMGAYRVSGMSGNYDDGSFDIVIGDNSDDICLYWNLRAIREVVLFKGETRFGRRVLFIPWDFLKNEEGIIDGFKEIIKKMVLPNNDNILDLRFYCSNTDILSDISILFDKTPLLKRFSNDINRSRTIYFKNNRNLSEDEIENRVLSYSINIPIEIPEFYFESLETHAFSLVNLRYGFNEIRIEPPPSFHNLHNDAVAVDLVCDLWERYPKCHRVSDSIQNSSHFSRYGLTSIINLPNIPHFKNHYLPTERESIKLYFQQKGYEAKSSKIEQYSQSVVSLLGGIENVQILANKIAYNLLSILSLKSSEKLAKKIAKEINSKNEQVEDIKLLVQDIVMQSEIKNIPRTFTQLTMDARVRLKGEPLLEILDSLVKNQVLKRGFHIPCPNCGTQNWYPLEVISEYILCPGCSHRFILPVREPDSPSVDMQWRYTLNTLVNRAVDQDVLVGILALYYLSKEKKTYGHTYGLELWKEGKQLTDIDFLFVSEQHLYGGECKSGTFLGDKDFKIAKTAAELGFVKFYFCTVSQFNEDVMAKIQALQNEINDAGLQTKIEVLSGSELLID